ncbi:MAG: class A beta-lactamase-related serine hydrolase [Bacteroidetes bacterium]|nr:MAG: class A beta-lactamase-related serine hydrolase [Bacteroidota bacterium]
MKKPLALLASVLLCAFHTMFSQSAQSIDRQVLRKELDSLLALTQPRFFNGVLLLMQDEKVLYAGSRGYRDIGRHQKNRMRTSFAIASLSKQMTAVLVLKEVEAGRLRLHDPLATYLPELPESWADSVTIHQLLSQTSGIVERGKPLRFRPGTNFAYSNTNYNLLGDLVARSSGQSFDTLALAFFRSCGLRHTFPAALCPNPEKLSGYSENESGNLDPEADLCARLAAPSGGMISNARDLAAWNRLLHGGRLLTDSSYQYMTQPYGSRSHRWGPLGYGYGLQISPDGELSHSGYVPGFISTMIYDPESRITLILLENIAWDADDMGRTFFFHDEVRKILYRQISSHLPVNRG